MEIFQNVDEWLISTDVGSVLASCWKEAEPVPGSDDDGDTSYLTPACIADDFECYDVADYLNSPVQSKPPYSLFKQYLESQLLLAIVCIFINYLLVSFRYFK